MSKGHVASIGRMSDNGPSTSKSYSPRDSVLSPAIA